MLDLHFFYNLYIGKKYIFYEHIRVCCGCDVIVIYDVIDHQIEMISIISANNIESCIANNTKMKFQISKLTTVTRGLVIRVILLYEARVAKSL